MKVGLLKHKTSFVWTEVLCTVTTSNQCWQVWSNFDKFEPILTSFLQIWLIWTNFDSFKPILTGLNKFERVLTSLIRILQDWLSLVWFKMTWHEHLLTYETWFMAIWLQFQWQTTTKKSDSKMGAYTPIKMTITKEER